MAFTRVLGPGIHTEADIKTNSINATGIITATGGFDGPFTKLNVTGDVVVGGALTVGGVLTYEDVTNIDAIGIITARSGIDIDGDLDVDGHTNLDNVSITGVSTFNNTIDLIALTGSTPTIRAINASDKLQLRSNGLLVNNQNGFRGLEFTGSSIQLYSGQMASHKLVLETDAKGIKVGTGVTIETNGQATYTGIVTALDFQKADGSSLGVGAGGTWSSYSAGIATSKSVGINTTNLDDTRITGVGNSFKGLYISNGMMVNDARLDGDHFIGADVNGMMVGPVNITGTLTVEGNYVVF